MKESDLVRKIMKAVKTKYPAAYVVKLADRYRRGLPDLLIVCPLMIWHASPSITLFVEVKTDDGVVSAIQAQEHREIFRAGGLLLVARSVEDVLMTLQRAEAQE